MTTHAHTEHGGHAHHDQPMRDEQQPHAAHDKHAGHSVEMFRRKFWGTLLLTIPTLIWAPMIQQWFHYSAPGGATALNAVFGLGQRANCDLIPVETNLLDIDPQLR